MDASIKTYKKKFDRDLKHIKIILTNERPRMPFTVWMALVAETKQLVLNSPQDFFCGELPSPPTLSVAIEQVFQGFIEDQRIRAVQTSQPFKLPFCED